MKYLVFLFLFMGSLFAYDDPYLNPDKTGFKGDYYKMLENHRKHDAKVRKRDLKRIADAKKTLVVPVLSSGNTQVRPSGNTK